MKRILILFTLSYFGALCQAYAQDSIWTLSKCIQHAQVNNLSIKQDELDARAAKMIYQSSKYSHIPSLNLSSNYGTSFGRSINPTTNQFENTKFSSLGLSAGSSVLLFGWFQKRYAIQSNELKYKIAQESMEQLKNDLLLNVATAYLRALLAKEQITNVLYQIEISTNNQTRIEKLTTAGRSNILELSQAKTQFYNDKGIYLEALLNYEQSLIDLKVILNIDLQQKIVPVPNLNESVFLSVEEIDPEAIYNSALTYIHSIKSSTYNVQVAEKDIQLTKAKELPQLSLNFSSGTNYSSSYYEVLPSGDSQLISFGKQFNNNLSHFVGLGLNIPVFNNFSSRDAIRSAKIGLEKARITDEENKQKLKQEIYKSCIEYKRTLQQYNSSLSALENAGIALKAATIRQEKGFISYFEYLTEKNNFLKIQNETTALKYELQFKKITVEYFQGIFTI
ncbi:TolC family protein [Flavobacterium sp. PL02]|uniref:TolC family protein n=1 Tax=Flavobacterium sp. PL02 TaxID=3088354 RepID=UPI002B2320C7|nr:TolC family protein [Flavobacterium sp. PL02]MEA9414321.1 TolC family protein [Flavobacterium sp. PL02]